MLIVGSLQNGEAYNGSPKEITIYNDSGFYKYSFEDRIGANLELIFLGTEKIKFLDNELLKWKKGSSRD